MDWTLVAWVGGYLVAAVVTARLWLAREYRELTYLESDDYWMSAMVGVIWPVVAAALLFCRTWVLLVTPSAVRRDRRAATERKRAEAARLAAMEAGLPFPDQDATP